MSKVIAALMAVSLLAACDSTNSNEVAGTLIGAAIGAGLGAHAHGRGEGAAIAFGAMAGGLIGNRVGHELDEAERIKQERATYHALEYGRSYDTTGWYDPDQGARGSVTPQPGYYNRDGRYCREFQQSIIIDGQEQRGYGTACRQPDGSWEIVS